MKRIIIILLPVIFIGIGFYFYYNFELTFKSEKRETIQNWKTYLDRDYNFKISYPQNWQIISQNSAVVVVRVADINTLPKPDTDQPSNFILVRKNNESDLENLQTGKIQRDSGWVTGIGDIPWRTIYVRGKSINIVMSALNSDAKKIEEQILSTFEFSE